MALVGVILLVLGAPSFGLYQPSLVIRERGLVVRPQITSSIDEGAHIKERYRARRGIRRGGILVIIDQVVLLLAVGFCFCIAFVGAVFCVRTRVYCSACCFQGLKTSRNIQTQQVL